MFGIGFGEVLLVLIVLGILAGAGYSVYRLAGGGRARELEAAKRDFEREIEKTNRRERLPKG